MLPLDAIIEGMISAAKEAGAYLKSMQLRVRDLEVETKSLNSFVTEADKTSEAMLIQRLEALVPEAGFIAEEGTKSDQGQRHRWIIDPLDGTTNFIHGLPSYCISLALADGDRLLAGVIYEPNLDECFHAHADGPAFLNGKPIRVSKAQTAKDSLLATGFPYHDYGKMQAYLDVLGHLMQNTHGLRRWGSAAIDLAYVACGRFDAFYEYGLQPWDVAAGALIVQQAGGKVSTFSGGNDFVFGQEILASNGHTHAELLDAICSRFPVNLRPD
ncbi:MAG: inositol monophosphatase [Flavobacteriales bacterium]|nr:inositol monophosphatase [Flavobacteriales bacterium]MCB9448953.1 inositol monophosphatase [Flavobacteriales bacterium]